MLTPLRVLIVEDVDDDAELMLRVLKKGGYDPEYLRVQTAETMREALENSHWDIILCDYNLPNFNMPAAIAMLMETNLDIPLIIVSGTIGEETAVECMRLGARDYIRKENLSLLVPAINRELTEARIRNSLERVEVEWRKSWENYRLLAEATTDFILTTDRNFIITFANKAFRNLLGNIEPVGLSIVYFTLPRLQEMQQKIMKMRQEGYSETLSYEWEFTNTQGQLFVIDVKSQALQEDGKFAGILFTARDITERKQAEEAMKRLVDRFDLATRAADLCVWDRDIQTDELLWDDGMFKLYGLTKGLFAVSYEAWIDRVHPDDINRTQEEIQKALSGEKDYNTEFRIIHPDGTVKHVRAYGAVTRDDHGKPLRMTGINYDITGPRQATDALGESERKYRSLFTEISEGFALCEIICNEAGAPVDFRFLDINPAFERLTGMQADKIIGQNGRRVMPMIEDSWIEQCGKIALSGEADFLEYHSDRYNRCFQINAFCPQKGQFAVLFTDITERKRMEAQLIQSQKLEAIGTLAGGIAHDFNNTLGAIIGYAGIIQEDLPEKNAAYECIEEIFRACDRAKNLVGQILEFSRNRGVERKPLMVVPVIKEIVKLLRPMLPAAVHVKLDIDIEDVSILADATQIHQVVMNLCTNAAHAMRKKGGTLTLRLRQIDVREDNSLQYAYLETGTYLELQVADTGHGIDEKIRNQIFDPFFTTKKTGEGTGMGLSIVHGIVKSYDGYIDFDSKEGRGTTFFIYLPLLPKQSITIDNEAKVAAVRGSERILLVDDHDFLLKMMSMSLSRLGYMITPVESSIEALKIFKADPQNFDLVITDQTMPYLSGIDMAKDMLLIRPSLPIILCTGFSATISLELARRVGIRQYVTKPFVMDEFSCLVRKVLEEDRQQYETEQQALEKVQENKY